MRSSNHYRCGGDHTPPRRRQWSALSTCLPLALVVLALLMTLVPSAEAAGSTWFVNDTSTVGDAFTSAIGTDTGVGAPNTPFLKIDSALAAATAGDTILIDSGTYFPAATLLIETNGILLMGVDSAGTVIDADWNLETGIAVLGAANLTIRNLRIARVWLDGGIGNNIGIGVALYGAATPRFENIDLTDLGTAIYAFPGTDSLTVSGSRFWDNNPGAIEAETSPRISLLGNVFGNPNPNSDGVSLNAGCDSAYIVGNTNIPLSLTDALYCRIENNVTNRSINLAGNSSRGRVYNNRLIANAGGSGMTINGNENEVDSNLIDWTGGTSMTIGGDSNLVTRNFATGPTGGGGVGYGFHVSGGGNGNILRENVASGKWLNGYRIDGTYNLFETNIASSCGAGSSFDGCGFRLVITGDTNVFVGNVASTNRSAGFSIERGGNVFVNNRATGTTDGPGFALAGASATGNRLIQNRSDSNIGYALSITVNAAGNVIEKNNFSAVASKPDSLVLYNGTASVNLIRNWFNTIDNLAIRAKIKGTGADSVIFVPYRLGAVDTALNADTVAPAAPAWVMAQGLDTTTIRVTWAATGAASEEPEAVNGLNGYRVWRAAHRPDAERGWLVALGTVGAGTTEFSDTGRAPGFTYHYRVTAFDNHPTINESFFSDSIPMGATLGIQSAEIPEGLIGQYDTVLANIIGSDTGYSLSQNNVDTVVLKLPSQSGADTWNIEIGFPDTGNQLLIRQVQASEMAASNTSRIEAFAKGQNLTLEIVAFDSSGAQRPQSYWATAPESPVLTFELGNSGLKPHRAKLFWLNTADSVWYDVTDPVNGMTSASYTRTDTMISIPVDHFTHFFPGEGSVDTVTVVLADTIPGRTIFSGSQDTITAITLLVLGDTGAGDTITRFAVGNKGNAPDTLVNAVTLWHSATGASTWNPGDTPVGTLAAMGGGLWSADTLAYNVAKWGVTPSAETFLVTFRLTGGAANGETFQAFVPIQSVKTELEDTGPSAERMNPGIFSIASGFQATKYLGPQPVFESDSIRLANRIWIESDGETLSILTINMTPLPARVRVLETSGLGDSITVEIDTGTGTFVLLGDTPILGGVGQIDALIALAPETNFVRITIYDMTTGAPPAVDTGTFFIDLMPPTFTDSSRLINGTDTYTRSGTVTLTFTAAGVSDTGPGGVDRFDVSASDTFGPAPGTWIGASFGDTTYQIPPSAIVNSAITLYFRFYDDAENASETAIASIRVFTDSNVIYVNDTSAAGDAFTSALGSNDTGTGRPDAPFRSIGFALAIAQAGETILVDAGLYAETVVIATDSVALVGKDSASTIIDPPGDSAVTTLYGIYADTLTNLTIKNLRITQCYYGIYFNNVDNSLIENVTADWCGKTTGPFGAGFNLDAGSVSNTIQNCYAYKDFTGIRVKNSGNNTVTDNISSTNTYSGISILNASNNCVLTGNVSSNNISTFDGYGFAITSSNNTLTNNTTSNNSNTGFSFSTSSSNNIITGNTSSYNDDQGFYFSASSNNLIIGNTSSHNDNQGFYFTTTSDTNLIVGNTSSNNKSTVGYGYGLNNSNNNYFAQNTADSNQMYGFYITGTSSRDTLVKNNWIGSPTNPDSAVFNSSSNRFDFTRNWFGATDSQVVRKRIAGVGADSITFAPYRLGLVDTAPGADTVAPSSPDTVAVSGAGLTATVSWAASVGSEEPEAAANLTGYRVYRALSATDTAWTLIGAVGPATRTYADTTLQNNTAYFFRVTAVDAQPIVNESFYSDSIVTYTPAIPIAGRFFFGPPTGSFETDSAELSAGLWISATETLVVQPLDSTTLNIRLKIMDPSLVADTVGVYVDSGSGFKLIRSDSIVGGVAILDFVNLPVLKTETNTVLVILGDTAVAASTADSEAGFAFADLVAPTVGNAAALTETGAMAKNSATVWLTFGAASVADTGPYGVKITTISDSPDFTGPGTRSLASTADTTYTIAPTVIPETGLVTLYFRFTDKAGNSTVVTDTIIVDTVPPVPAALLAPGAGIETKVATIAFSWSAATDTHSGVASYRLQIDTAGTFIASLVADSNAGLATTGTYSLAGNATYFWRVLATDNAGLSTASETRSLVIDTLCAVTLTSPDSGAVRDSRPVFSWTGTGVETYVWQIDTTTAFTSIVDSKTLNLTSYQPDIGRDSGAYYWRVIAYDRVGNFDTSAARYLVIDTDIADTTPPDSFNVVAPANLLETSATTILFAWNLTNDTGTGVATYRLQADTTGGNFAAPVVETTVSAATTSAPLTLVGTETYLWRVVATDAKGNPTATTPQTIFIDTTPPVAAGPVAPPALTDTSATTILFTWTAASDTHSGLASMRLQIDTGNVFVNLVADSSAGLATSGAWTLSANDTYYWRILAVDDAGNTTAATSRRILIDTMPPVAAVPTSPANAMETSATTILFAWTTAYDSHAGLAAHRLQIDTSGTFASLVADSNAGLATTGAYTLAANATYYWRILATDDGGNTAASDSRSFTIDTLAVVTLVAPADSATQDSRPVFSWTGTGVETYTWQIDTAATFTSIVDSITQAGLSFQPTGLDSAAYYWRVIAYDRVGNVDTSASRYLVIDTAIVDTTPPAAFTLVSPANGYDTNLGTITFRWNLTTDTGKGVAAYRWEAILFGGSFASPFDSATVGAATDTISRTIAGTDTYVWRVVAIDGGGLSTPSTDSRILRVDTTPPVPATLSSPPDNQDTGATVGFSWTTASDTQTGISGYRLQISTSPAFGSFVVDSSTGLGLSGTATLAGTETYYWRVLAVDNAGCTAPSDSRSVRIDTTPPTVRVTLLDTAVNIIGPRIRIVATDAFGLGTSAAYRVTGDLDAGKDTTVGVWLAYAATDTLERTIWLTADSGVKTCTVTIRDRSGNTTETAIQTRYETGAISVIVQETTTPINFSETMAPAPGDTLIVRDPTGETIVTLTYPTGAILTVTASETLVFQDTILLSNILALIADTTRPVSLIFGSDSLLLYSPTTTASPVILNTVSTGETYVRFLPAALIATGETPVFTATSSTETVQFHIPITDTMKRIMARFELGNLAGGFTDTTNRGFTAVGDRTILDQTVREFRMTDSAGRTIEANDTYFPQGILIAFPIATGLRNNANLRPFYFRTSDSTWVSILEDSTMVFQAAADSWAFAAGDSTMRIRVRHFTFIGISPVDWAAATALSNVVVYPNPYVPYDGNAATGIPPSSGGGIYIGNLTAGAKIEIYDIRGRLVHEATNGAGGAMLWSARNRDNQEVASGVYLIVVRAGGQTVVKKVAVVR